MKSAHKNQLGAIFLAFVLAIVFMCSFPFSVYATGEDETENIDTEETDEPQINYCGNEATWVFEDGKLIIEGNGAIFNFSTTKPVPWKDNLSEIKTIIIKNGITSIGNYAFSNTKKLNKVVISNSVEHIGIGAFYGSSVKNVTIPSSVRSISREAFAESSVASVKLSRPLQEIPDEMFLNCVNLEKIELRENVAEIGDDAFKGCESLKEITLSKSLTDIGLGAFDGCTSLEKVNILFTDPYQCLPYGKFPNSRTGKFYVPKGTVNHFKASEFWAEYKDIIYEGSFVADEEQLEENDEYFADYTEEEVHKSDVDPYAIAFISIIIASFFLATAYYFISTVHKTHKKAKQNPPS